MIKFCDNKEEIISLWSSVFGDSDEEISFFIDNLKNGKCLAYYEKGKAVSMFFLVDCRVGEKKGKYIYAACTLKEYEGRGYMSCLIDYAGKNFNEFLCLIPANESLIDFYSQRGFDKTAEISELTFNENDEIIEYLFEGYELKKPLVMLGW